VNPMRKQRCDDDGRIPTRGTGLVKGCVGGRGVASRHLAWLLFKPSILTPHTRRYIPHTPPLHHRIRDAQCTPRHASRREVGGRAAPLPRASTALRGPGRSGRQVDERPKGLSTPEEAALHAPRPRREVKQKVQPVDAGSNTPDTEPKPEGGPSSSRARIITPRSPPKPSSPSTNTPPPPPSAAPPARRVLRQELAR
jgi:hypothetical protein